jgi:hypothetical protein
MEPWLLTSLFNGRLSLPCGEQLGGFAADRTDGGFAATLVLATFSP